MGEIEIKVRGKVEERLFGEGVKVSGSGEFSTDDHSYSETLGSSVPHYASRLAEVSSSRHNEKYEK
ncbi:MAG: hypothetical protein JW789_04575 [Candidatus Aenigmarchaeota archaeon]|nr:hypothetical protein [Candidatus Aenigmarchaeota archaeon]